MEEGILTIGDLTSIEELSKYHDYEHCKKCRYFKLKQSILFTVLVRENSRELYAYAFKEKCPREHGAEVETRGYCFGYEIKGMGKD